MNYNPQNLQKYMKHFVTASESLSGFFLSIAFKTLTVLHTLHVHAAPPSQLATTLLNSPSLSENIIKTTMLF